MGVLFVRACVYGFLTDQEVALGIQDFLYVFDPQLLDLRVGSLQRVALGRAVVTQHQPAGVAIRPLVQPQHRYLHTTAQALVPCYSSW